MESDEIELFINEIRNKFPDVSVKIDEWMDRQGYDASDKMYTSMMEEFSQVTTDAIKAKDEEKALSYLSYMSEKLKSATSKEYEYIDVYYVESLLWDVKDKSTLRFGWDLIPDNLKNLYIEMWGKPAHERIIK